MSFRAFLSTFGLAALVLSGTAAGAPAHWQQAHWQQAPSVTITSAPSNSTTSSTATFAFRASGTTRCRLDTGSLRACTSPVTYSVLSLGAHTFRVEATLSGRMTAATDTWTVTAPTPTPTPTLTPTPSPSPAPSVAAPTPPSTYTIPAGALAVSTSSQLITALQGSNQNIVLADGTYDNASPFMNTNNRLYAAHVGQAVLKAGLVLGGNFGSGGGLVQGLTFDVSDPNKTLGGGIIHIWGPGGVNSRVLDTTFRGNKTIPVGLLAYNPQGLVAQRDQFFGFTDVGLRASNNQPVAYGGSTPHIANISDIYVDGVTRATPGASNGTAEAGIWIGHPVDQGVQRLKIRNVSWSGLETVNNAWNTTYSDLDIDMSGPSQFAGVAVYMEHMTQHTAFTNFAIRGARVGFNGEWNDGVAGNAACHFVTIDTGRIDATGSTLKGRQAGVYLDEGSDSTTIRNVKFLNQNWAGIGMYKVIGSNTVAPNDFGGLRSGAVATSTDHI
jgi:hypothetical protein